MIAAVLSRRTALAVCLALLLVGQGCLHRIHVTPTPPMTADRQIGKSVQVVVPFLALKGADHMPGIGSLSWPADDLRSGAIAYFQQRRTFETAGTGPADLTLTIKTWLTLRSRGHYVYRLHMESELGPSGAPPLKTYVVDKEAAGSTVRWVTASDRDPIQQTVQAALDDLAQQIEGDAALYRRGVK
ncbi:MAG TPA: hypothetical protein VFS39_18055 [Nitrospira sp.]|nr:hypothetical protein [Nitrospira sp.]